MRCHAPANNCTQPSSLAQTHQCTIVHHSLPSCLCTLSAASCPTTGYQSREYQLGTGPCCNASQPTHIAPRLYISRNRHHCCQYSSPTHQKAAAALCMQCQLASSPIVQQALRRNHPHPQLRSNNNAPAVGLTCIAKPPGHKRVNQLHCQHAHAQALAALKPAGPMHTRANSMHSQRINSAQCSQ